MGWHALSLNDKLARAKASAQAARSQRHGRGMKPKSVIVIGAGIGGITAATHLARAGLHVTVLEKNAHPGGRCDRLSRDGHHFDTGPTLFVMPLFYEAEFRALGASMHERLDLQRVDPTYHLVFDDGSQLALTSDLKSLQEQLEAIEPGSFQGLLRYLQEGQRHYQVVLDRLVNRDFRKASDFFNLQNLPLIFHLKPLANHYRNMSASLTSPRLKAAFHFSGYVHGAEPVRSARHFFDDALHRAGARRLVSERRHVPASSRPWWTLPARLGWNSSLTRPWSGSTSNQPRARGVLLADGTRLEADVVLANADLPYVYQHLLPQDGMVKALSRKRYSLLGDQLLLGSG